MDLTQIRYFLALARTLNFTRAAEACNVTQPALTKSIQRLEDELGGPLLLRERALTQLTRLGQEMLPLLEQTHAAAVRAKEHAAGLKLQAASPLRVGFAPDAPTPPFAPLFTELAAHLPGFELSVAEAGADGLFDGLLHGTLDVAVVTGAAAPAERLNSWSLFTDQVVLLVPSGHALATADPILPDALDGEAVICRGPDCAMARLLGPVRDGASPARTRSATRHQADTQGRVADLVRAGLGVALSTGLAAPPDGLQRRPLLWHAAHDVVLVAVAGRPYPRAADAFVRLARARAWQPAGSR